jgi:DNA polymerase
MSERDPRAELADIASSVKRYVERERAAGTGELLARGATAARGPSRPAPLAEGPAPPAAALSSAIAAPASGELPAPGRAYAFDLPPVHPPLNSIEIAERAQMQSAAFPMLELVAAEARACRKCGLCETRKHAVPGVGSATGGIVFVGEAPGADEDAQGEPFVGRAGQLLTQIIKAMDEKQLIPGVTLDRSTVYIMNVLKCRPPENRNPLPHEIEACSPYLRRQLDVLKPRVICCLGKFAAELLVGVKGTIAGLRGKVYRYQGAKLIVTYHPAACLRNPGYKRPVWEDMQLLAREYLGQGVS